jgi:hypothetical protein
VAKSKRQIADEAYLRVMATPLPDGTLPGQIDALSGEMAGVSRFPADPEWGSVPPECPGCGRKQTAQRGWTAMSAVAGRALTIQCGGCGKVVPVADSVHERVRQIARAEFAGSDRPPAKVDRGARQRGAG